MDAEERLSLERRIGHLEREISASGALLTRNTQILDDIRTALNEPKRYPEWIAAAIAVLVLCGTLLYTAYIAPLEERMGDLKEMAVENRTYIRDIGDYAKETRGVIDAHTSSETHTARRTDNR